MTIPVEIRAFVRSAYQYRCGYCGISEPEIGSELEIDHFQPTSHGGTDEPDNLVCACTACNRFKGAYWPEVGTPESLHLLHPGRDDITSHISELADGRLSGLTPRGWFHIRWLHLNRVQLVEWRRLRTNNSTLLEMLEQTQVVNQQLRKQIIELEEEINRLHALINQLARNR